MCFHTGLFCVCNRWMRAIGFLVDFRGSYKENRRTDVDIFDTSQL